MILLGTIVDTVAIVIGAFLGLFIGRFVPERINDTLLKGLGVFTLYLGISGINSEASAVLLVVSLMIGAVIGEGFCLQDRIDAWGENIQRKLSGKGAGSDVMRGFIAAVLLYGIGAMPIVGGLRSGLSGDHSYLYSKAIMDGIVAILFSSSMGVGVMFSAAFVFLLEGGIALLAGALAPYLTTSMSMIDSLGALLLLVMGVNLTGLGKFKLVNYLPAIPVAIVLCQFF